MALVLNILQRLMCKTLNKDPRPQNVISGSYMCRVKAMLNYLAHNQSSNWLRVRNMRLQRHFILSPVVFSKEMLISVKYIFQSEIFITVKILKQTTHLSNISTMFTVVERNIEKYPKSKAMNENTSKLRMILRENTCWFGLVSSFNGISTFESYSIPKQSL